VSFINISQKCSTIFPIITREAKRVKETHFDLWAGKEAES